MKTEKKIIIFSILLGLFATVIDNFIDYFAFYEKPFWDLMIFDVPTHEVYIRSILLATFTIYGIIISKIIAKRKRAEEALRESEEKYRILFESSKDPSYITTPEGDIVEANQSHLDLFGYTREELFEWKAQSTYVNPDDRSRFKKEIEENGFVKDFEVKLRKKDGTELDCLATASVRLSKEGSIVGYQGIIRDVTELKRSEEALRESEQKYRTVLESNPDPVVVYDMEGKVTYMNPAFTRVFGWSLEERIGKKMDDFVPEENWPETRMMIDKVMAGQHFYGLETRRYTKEGSIIPISISGSFYRDQEGSLVASVINLRDTSEQKKLEAQLLQSQKMEAIGRLSGGVAHDFNNLLTTIIGYTEIMLMKVDKDSPLRSGMEEINKAADRAASLTSQLLAFSRKQMIQPVVLNINHAIAEMDKMLRRLIGEDIDLVTILEPELWKVKFDSGQMDQVIMNLAVNAKDAMPNGGKLTIETANVDLDEAFARQHGVEMKTGPFVVVVVSDTGMGIDEETQSHIFEPFFTTKEKDKGTGLGLSTVYGIVKQSEGFIWVYSEPGQGTTFKIYLPKIKEEAPVVEEKQMQPQNLEGSETILLAEDEDSARKLIRSTLQEYGYRVLEAQDGKEALQLIEHHKGPIHLLLTDVVMPGMSGRELAERLQPLQPKMKILYMSGYTDNVIVHHGVLESGILFIQKPFTPKVLMSKIRKVLDT